MVGQYHLPILAIKDLYRHFVDGTTITSRGSAAIFLFVFIPILVAISASLVKGRGIIYIEDFTIIVFSYGYYAMPISTIRSFTLENEGKLLVIRSAETVQKIPAFLVEGPASAAIERWDAWNENIQLAAYREMPGSVD